MHPAVYPFRAHGAARAGTSSRRAGDAHGQHSPRPHGGWPPLPHQRATIHMLRRGTWGRPGHPTRAPCPDPPARAAESPRASGPQLTARPAARGALRARAARHRLRAGRAAPRSACSRGPPAQAHTSAHAGRRHRPASRWPHLACEPPHRARGGGSRDGCRETRYAARGISLRGEERVNAAEREPSGAAGRGRIDRRAAEHPRRGGPASPPAPRSMRSVPSPLVRPVGCPTLGRATAPCCALPQTAS